MKRAMVMGGLALAGSALAQEAMPPALLVKGEDGTSAPLRVDDVNVNVKVVGNVAETVITLRFRNETDRVLEGELVFPMGEGRTVSRYALEIDGRMRAGVSVPKDRGRAVFESVVRRQIDPGLLEWTKGNNFRTRIYPIPANGTKSVEVGYEEELAEVGEEYLYRLPLAFPDALDRFRVKVAMPRPLDEPLAPAEGHEGLTWTLRENDARIAEAEAADFAADETLELVLPREREPAVAVEQWRGGRYFYLLDRPEIPAEKRPRPKPKSLHLVWDASESGRQRQVAKELELLDRYVRWLGEATITLTWLRNELADGGTFTAQDGKCPALWNALTTVRYDGATRLDQLDFREEPSDAILLVSDGVATMGEADFKVGSTPIFALHGSESAAHGLLRRIATESGGAYANLAPVGVDEGFTALTEHRFSLISTELNGGKEVYPAMPQPVSGAIGVAGQLTTDQPVTLTLNYGWGREVTTVRKVEIDPAKHRSELGRVPRLWAQRKLEALDLAPERNRSAIEELAKAHGLVTRFTSLIVLDRIEDYVEFRIVPPEPEMHDEYLRLLEAAPDPDEPDPDHLSEMLALWKERCDWHDGQFPELREIVFGHMDNLRAQLAELQETLKELPAPENDEERRKADEIRAVLASFEEPGEKLAALQNVPEDQRGEPWEAAGHKLAGELLPIVKEWQERLGPGRQWGANFGAIAGASLGVPMSAGGDASAPPAPSPPPTFVDAEESFDPFSDDRDPVASVDPSGNADPFAGVGDFATLRAGDGAITRNSIDAILNNPNRSARDAELDALDAVDEYEPPELPNQVGATAGIGSGAQIFPVTPATPTAFETRNTGATLGIDISRDGLHALLTKEVHADRRGTGILPASPGTQTHSEPATGRETPYLDALKTAPEGADLEAIYFSWKARDEFGTKPAFYLDVSDILFERGERALALRILSNVAELQSENVSFLRILAHRFAQVGELPEAELLFREVLDLRDDEPQSWRDLALVCERRGNFQEALDALWHVVTHEWDERFPAVQMVALTELNSLVARHGSALNLSSIDERFLRNLDCDLRVVLSWDADNTDVDLWVTGPAGERCFYEHDRTLSGGFLSEDFTGGYGPEEFLIRRALPGTYRIEANYFGNDRQTLAGATTIQATVFRNWGRPTQERSEITLRLETEEDLVAIGSEQFP